MNASAKRKKGMALIALGSWADSTVQVRLKVDWKALGMDENKISITAPAIKNFQLTQSFTKEESIPVEKNKGWLLLVHEQ